MATIALLWPGVATYDTLSQYGQAISGDYDDWHPPVMARLWSGSLAVGASGSGPMLALQWMLLWAGIAGIARALARAGAPRAAAATLAIPVFPILASWMACVLKDCQLIGALVAATGLVASDRLAGRRPAPIRIAGVAVLLGYAVLLRANAVFTVAPLVLAWSGWPGARRLWQRAGSIALACLAVIGVSGPINHRVLGASPSEVARTLPLFDMAGIAHRAHLATLPDLPAAQWAHAERIGCATPFYWDPLGDPAKCGPIATRLAFDRDPALPSITGEWLRMIAAHPLAYAAHRLAHLNATLRIAVPAGERLAAGPATSLANPAGIGRPPRAAAALLAPLAGWTAGTPAGVPALWLLMACGLWWTLAGTPVQPARALGLAAAVSAAIQTASFAVVSIASDLRYHLWLMVGTMLAAAFLAACHGVPRRRVAITLAVTAIAALASAAIRAAVVTPIG